MIDVRFELIYMATNTNIESTIVYDDVDEAIDDFIDMITLDKDSYDYVFVREVHTDTETQEEIFKDLTAWGK